MFTDREHGAMYWLGPIILKHNCLPSLFIFPSKLLGVSGSEGSCDTDITVVFLLVLEDVEC